MDSVLDASSYAFSWYAVPVLGVGLLCWLLGAATVVRERGSRPSLTLLCMTFAIGVWLVGLGMANATIDPDAAHAWVALSLAGTSFVPVATFAHPALGHARQSLMRALVAAGVVASCALAATLVWTDLLLADVHHYYWGYYSIFGPLGPVLMAYYAAAFVGGGAIYRLGRETNSPTTRTRMRLRLVAMFCAIPATVDFLPTMHIGVYPFGYAFILAFIAVSTYIIWKYRMVDITPALAAKQVIDSMAEGLLVVDRDGTVRVANDAAEAVWPGRKLVGANIGEMDAAWGRDALVRLADPSVADSAEVEFAGADGAPRMAMLASSRLDDHLGAWVGTVYIIHDITERWRIERAVRASEERFRSLVQNASDLITVISPDSTVRYQSPAIERVLGYDPEQATGQKLVDFVHPDDQAGLRVAIDQMMQRAGRSVSGEGRVRDASGRWRYLEFTGSDQRHNTSIGGLVLNVRDVTERKHLEEQLREQALHDPLTSLANRTRFTDRLEHALARGNRNGAGVAVLFMDLDNFKGINDSMGHPAGDALLTQVADRLRACMRPVDTVARLGGDEFAILMEDVHARDDAEEVAQRILRSLRPAFRVDARELTVGISIGIASNDGNGAYRSDQLLREADIAMYAAKAQGKGCYRVFESGMQRSMAERLELLSDLPRALAHGEFELAYQPIFCLATGEVAGVEALVRWRHARRGLVTPGEFIALAEESGAIVGIGSWVLEAACAQAAAWSEQSGARWTMSVNVSVKQLQQPAFVAEVAQALREHGLPPEQLILEITESVMMPEASDVLPRLRELKALGVTLAIDDFGTGYSSLAYLRQFPFDQLKIDRSFVSGLEGEGQRKELTRAIIELGKTLGLVLVAEGIEQERQLERLRAMACDLGQGFHLALPMPAWEVERYLRPREQAA